MLFGNMPIGNMEIVFIFVAFIVVANLISKHLELRQKHAFKRSQLESAQQEPQAKPLGTKEKNGQEKSGLGRGLLWTFGVVGVMFLTLALLLMPLAAVKTVSVSVPTENALHPPHVFEQQTSAGSSSVARTPVPLNSPKNWDEDLPFEANQYPSIEACVLPMARQIVKELESSLTAAATAEATGDEKESSTSIFISFLGGPAKHAISLKNALAETARSRNLSVSFTPSKDDKAHQLSFTIEDVEQVELKLQSKIFLLKKGKLACKWRLPKDGRPFSPSIASIAFTEKPWLTDFQNFTARFPSNAPYYTGMTSSVQPLRSKAHEKAVQEVAFRLRLREDQIEPYIVDKFTQAIERPYGRVFREAILVCNPPIAGRNLAAALPLFAEPNFEFSLALMLCLTVVAGFISNFATQGYYRTQISQTVQYIFILLAFSLFLVVLATLFA